MLSGRSAGAVPFNPKTSSSSVPSPVLPYPSFPTQGYKPLPASGDKPTGSSAVGTRRRLKHSTSLDRAEKPPLKRDDVICSTGLNERLKEDYVADQSMLFGRKVALQPNSRQSSVLSLASSNFALPTRGDKASASSSNKQHPKKLLQKSLSLEVPFKFGARSLGDKPLQSVNEIGELDLELENDSNQSNASGVDKKRSSIATKGAPAFPNSVGNFDDLFKACSIVRHIGKPKNESDPFDIDSPEHKPPPDKLSVAVGDPSASAKLVAATEERVKDPNFYHNLEGDVVCTQEKVIEAQDALRHYLRKRSIVQLPKTSDSELPIPGGDPDSIDFINAFIEQITQPVDYGPGLSHQGSSHHRHSNRHRPRSYHSFNEADITAVVPSALAPIDKNLIEQIVLAATKQHPFASPDFIPDVSYPQHKRYHSTGVTTHPNQSSNGRHKRHNNYNRELSHPADTYDGVSGRGKSDHRVVRRDSLIHPEDIISSERQGRSDAKSRHPTGLNRDQAIHPNHTDRPGIRLTRMTNYTSMDDPEEDARVGQPSSKEKDGLFRPLVVNGRFENPFTTWYKPTILNAIVWGLGSRDHTSLPSSKDLDKELPILRPDLDQWASSPKRGIRFTWLGHATALIQFDGITFLTDPMFSARASPVQFMGPKRFRDVPCSIHDLPKIDVVLLSHTHYDHLDRTSVQLLNARFGSDLRWFVPLGLRPWMRSVGGCTNVIELSWWEQDSVERNSEIQVIFTPTQHWSKRTPADDNKVLWGSWSVITPKTRFFFAGDTGYCAAFKQIGDRLGPFDLAAIPIGAYEPRWFMRNQHVDPEEAVQIHSDIRAKRSVAIHWGTFSLANEHYLEPPKKLHEVMVARSMPGENFLVFKHGEMRLFVD